MFMDFPPNKKTFPSTWCSSCPVLQLRAWLASPELQHMYMCRNQGKSGISISLVDPLGPGSWMLTFFPSTPAYGVQSAVQDSSMSMDI